METKKESRGGSKEEEGKEKNEKGYEKKGTTCMFSHRTATHWLALLTAAVEVVVVWCQ